MGRNFTDGPRGEADRGTDDDGNTFHRPQDNRNISGSSAAATARRMKARRVGVSGPADEGTDSFAGVEKAGGGGARMAEREVAHERHPETREGFGSSASE